MAPFVLLVLFVSVGFGALSILHGRQHGRGFVSALGLTLNVRALGDAVAGISIAALAMVAVFLTAMVSRTIEVVGTGPADPLWNDLPTYVMVPFLEELIFRGALLGGLLVLMRNRVWLAVLIAGAVFGALHLTNANATPLTGIGTTLGGIAYGIAFAATRSIWLPFGLHAAWNYLQGPVLGFALSGGKPLRGTFLLQESVGPVWFTGGEYGPEGGMLGVLGRIVVLLGLLALITRRRTRSAASGQHGTAVGSVEGGVARESAAAMLHETLHRRLP
jgi:uncharacterized protein